ncbi:MAG TPA: CaiB/BaiF CoA-transferase family protein [Thermoanaerobaculia bacterium]|nr:CaiB/BaiF CoA-transferase family protein [Thermoanaerobaculia bacterium]
MSSLLSGLLVLDLSRHLPGPLTARLLADLGARIVKVEEPAQGDPIRNSPPVREGVSALGAILLAGVESVALDLKQSGGREALERLIARADVLIESFRPGTLARLGFPAEELRARHPRLVIASISGWGQEGPNAARAGHDLTYQAVAGTLAPTAAMPGVQVADQIGAWSTVAAILAALFERERTGEGKRVDVALLDAGLHANLTAWATEAEGPKAVGERLPLTGALPCYNLYETADGHRLALGALEPHFWERFCRAVGRDDLLRRQYSSSPRARRMMEELFRGRTRDAWLALLKSEDIPVEAVLSAAEAREHPQVAARGVLATGPEGLPRLAFPARFDGARPTAGGAVPELGEQTKAVLAEVGAKELIGAPGVGRPFSFRRWVKKLLS